jgi:hypothetical protein
MFGFRRRHEDPSPSIVELVRGIVSDAIRLVRENVELVKARFSRTVKRAGIGAGVAAGGATMVFLGLVGLLVAAGLGLALVVDPWVAALIVSGALLGAGAAVAMLGVKEVRTAIDERSHGPVDMETALQETRYRLEAELDALTAKLDPRHGSNELQETATTNGRARTMPMPRTPK